jgi:hypothetical protein
MPLIPPWRATQFVHCCDCCDLFRSSPFDRVPEFHLAADGVVADIRDDSLAFLARHARHGLETLRPTGMPPLRTGPIDDPMTSTTWEVSNGRDIRLVQSWRTSVRDALRYRIVSGRLVTGPASVEISGDDIRDDVDRALHPGVAPDRKLDAFVELFKAVTWDLDPMTLEIAYDVPADSTSCVARLPRWALDRLAVSAREIFDHADAARIARRLGESATDCGAFTVLLRQNVRIE